MSELILLMGVFVLDNNIFILITTKQALSLLPNTRKIMAVLCNEIQR